MVVRASWLLTALSALLVVWLAWLFLLWRPMRQAELHTLNLLERASARDWPAVEAMMSVDYRDAWGHDRALAIAEARQLFSHFFALQIVALAPLRIAEESEALAVSAPVGVFGSGTAVAQAVIEEVRDARGDAEFVWRRAGGWPWQWVLAEIRHEELAGRWSR
jgi:hypothetical protein